MVGERIDKKHRITLRMEKGLFHECEALTLKHDISLNLLFNEMIQFSINNNAFNDFLNRHYKPDERHGHFIYVRSGGK
jgi:hypothetical protein